MAAVGLKLAKTPRRALLSLLFRRAQLRLRGLKFRERPANAIPQHELTRIDTCWSAAAGLANVDIVRGTDFQTQHLLLALRAGEPERVARAMAAEAGFISMAGMPARERAARLLKTAEELATRLARPYPVAFTKLVAAIAAFEQGRWCSAARLFEDASALFTRTCSGVAWEISTCCMLHAVALFYLGELRQLATRLPIWIEEAEARQDRYASTSLRLSNMITAWLAQDDVRGARATIRRAIDTWTSSSYLAQHFYALLAQTHVDLYEDRGTAAWERVTAEWPALSQSLLPRVQLVRIEAWQLRARAALGAAFASSRDALLESATVDARLIERERTPWATPLARLIHAGVAALRGNATAAHDLVVAAARGFDSADMPLYAAVARHRQGELLSGDDGQHLIQQADTWMAGQMIKNPVRMAAMLAPGFGR